MCVTSMILLRLPTALSSRPTAGLRWRPPFSAPPLTKCTARACVKAYSGISNLPPQEEDILTEGSEVERPQGTAEGLSEIGSERRYATRQATRTQQGTQLGNFEHDKVSTPVPHAERPAHAVEGKLSSGTACDDVSCSLSVRLLLLKLDVRQPLRGGLGR